MRYSIIIPTKEEPYIFSLVSEINNKIKDHEIIIVDKSKTTPVFSDRNVKVLRQKSDGLGNAFLEGVKSSRGEILALMDGDGSHSVDDLKAMLEESAFYDIVVGSKILGQSEDSLFRRFISSVFNTAARYWLGYFKVKDLMSGFMVVHKTVLEKISLSPKGYKIVLEILIKTRNESLSILEQPVNFKKRKAGRSKSGVKEAINILNLLVDLKAKT